MKGDFSRIRFNPAKQYTSVLKQQGRVDLDSDANEQRFIDETLRDTINLDVIGRYGAPENDPGFAIRVVGNEIAIGPGRYYVDGILVENPHWRSYDNQPCLIDPSFSGTGLLNQLIAAGQDASLGLVLEVWQRLTTALDDPCLLEPALNQADTTARLQTVWRVVGTVNTGSDNAVERQIATHIVETNLKSAVNISQTVLGTETDPLEANPVETQLGNLTAQTNSPYNPITQLSPCCQSLYGDLRVARTGAMGASTGQGGNECGCQPIAAAGYQGLENQLYRVEIHRGGDLTSATFKWSRENASVVTAITSVGANSPIITVASLGPDANLGFQAEQWVELTDDTYQFGDTPNQPGPLFKISSINQATLQVTMYTPVYGIDTTRNARMRRWDQKGTSATNTGIPVSSTPIPLENGIQVDFRAGQYQPGDYWLIPARTASGQIDWPPCGGSGSYFQPASFISVYRAPLACISLRAYLDDIYIKGVTGTAEARVQVNDCRLFFPPLTAVSAHTTPAALHVKAITWPNDDVITVDTLIENGLSVTFDQPTTCPWGGGNFQVAFEVPFTSGDQAGVLDKTLPGIPKASFKFPPGTDCFIRTVLALDPPWGVIVSGNQVSWMSATSSTGNVNYAAYAVLEFLNLLLRWQQPIGFGRVRVRLIGSSVYGSGANGNIYLDGQSFGNTGSRVVDDSPCVSLTVPSGDALAVSDYESWFYVAPTVYVVSVVIQGINNGQETTIKALKVIVNSNNQVTGLQIGESAVVTQLQALITLSYAPVSPTLVTLTFSPVSGATASNVASIASSVQIPAGQQTYTTPINITSNPGAGNTDVVSLVAAVPVLQISYPVAAPPQLSIAGMTPPAAPPPPPPPAPK